MCIDILLFIACKSKFHSFDGFRQGYRQRKVKLVFVFQGQGCPSYFWGGSSEDVHSDRYVGDESSDA